MNKLPSTYQPKGNYPWQNPTWQDLRELAESREEDDE